MKDRAQRRTEVLRVAIAVLGVAAVAIVATWSLAAIGGSRAAELDAAASARALAAGPAGAAAWRLVTRLGASYVLWPLVALAIVLLARSGRREPAWLLAEGMLGAFAVEHVVKLAFHRPRPLPHWGDAVPLTYSYPSGHALLTTCFFLLLAWLLGRRTSPGRRAVLLPLAAALALAVGLSRLALGVHYATDVLGGHAIALLWLAGLRLARHRGEGAQGQNSKAEVS